MYVLGGDLVVIKIRCGASMSLPIFITSLFPIWKENNDLILKDSVRNYEPSERHNKPSMVINAV